MKEIPGAASVTLLLIAALAIIWPAFYNGQPFYFADTSAYVRGADAGIERITGISTPWSQNSSVRAASAGNAASTEGGKSHKSLSSVEDGAVLSGRSIYYGALLYLGRINGEFWLAIFCQAVMLISALMLALRSCNVSAWPCFAILVAVACVTSASFYASMLMPDIFAALTILACAILIAAGGALSTVHRIFWCSLLTFSLLVHSAHILLATSMLMIGICVFLLGKRNSNTCLITIVLSLVAALIGEAAFNYAVTRMLGASPIRPPFLMARMIDDGPGYDYLHATCPRSGFIVCQFLHRLPLPADEFLWLGDPNRGVFAASSPEVRRALSQEQLRFVVSVLSYDFPGQIRASARNSLKQARLVRLQEFTYPQARKEEFHAKLPNQNYSRMQRTEAYRGTMPLHWFSMLSYGLPMAAFIYIAYVCFRSRARGAAPLLTSVRVAAFVVIGILSNAVICGALSTPHHRYQARVIWLLPIMALIVDFEWRRKWWNRVFASAVFNWPCNSRKRSDTRLRA